MNYIRIAILTIISILSLPVFAQRYEMGIIGSASGYMGDLNNTNPFYFKKFGGGLFLKYNLDPTWGLKLNANQLLILGEDKDFENDFQQTRDIKFRNLLTEIALTTEFNFWTYYNSQHTSRITPYILAGLGIVKHDPYVYYDQYKVKLRPLKLEYDEATNPSDYSTWNVVVPVGLGIKYRLNSSWSLGVEASYRIAFTDYLDNVSLNYATSNPENIAFPNILVGPEDNNRLFDLNDWRYLADPSGNLTRNAGSNRGDGRKRDGYMTAGITLTYTIFDRNCYSWIKR